MSETILFGITFSQSIIDEYTTCINNVEQYNKKIKSLTDEIAKTNKEIKRLDIIEFEETYIDKIINTGETSKKIEEKKQKYQKLLNEFQNTQKEGFSEKMHIMLSDPAKLYAFIKHYEKKLQKLIEENNSSQASQIINHVKENINKHPLLVSSPEASIGYRDGCTDPISYKFSEISDIIKNKEEKPSTKQNINGQIKHTSLSTLIKKEFPKKEEILKTISLTSVSRLIGALPPEWISIIPQEKMSKTTKEVAKKIKDFAIKTLSTKFVEKDLLTPYTDNLSTHLSAILGTKINVEFIESGKNGKVFKITTGKNALALKTNHFYSKYSQEHTHGTAIEGAAGYHIGNSDDKKRFAKTYMANLGEDYKDRDIFMISRFQDKENALLSFNRSSISRFISYDLHNDNFLYGRIIDFGGFSIKEGLDDKYVYLLSKKILKFLTKKDGKERLEQLQRSHQKTPYLKKKLDKAIKALNNELPTRMPDISYGMINNYGLNQEAMSQIGVSNHVDTKKALCSAEENQKALEYVINSRGGAEAFKKALEDEGLLYPEIQKEIEMYGASKKSQSIQAEVQKKFLSSIEK